MTKDDYQEWKSAAAKALPQMVSSAEELATELKEHDKKSADLVMQYASAIDKLAQHLKG